MTFIVIERWHLQTVFQLKVFLHIHIKDSSLDLGAEQNTSVPKMIIVDEQDDEAQATVSRDNLPAVVDDEYTIPGQIGYHLD